MNIQRVGGVREWAACRTFSARPESFARSVFGACVCVSRVCPAPLDLSGTKKLRKFFFFFVIGEAFHHRQDQ